MSKEHFETWIVVKGVRGGKRYAERRTLHVPLDLAVGNYERLSDLQLREAATDLAVEAERRNNAAQQRSEIEAKCGGYDPFASQVRRQP